MARPDPVAPSFRPGVLLLLPPPRHIVRKLDMQPARPVPLHPDVSVERPEPPLALSAALRFRRYVRRERLT